MSFIKNFKDLLPSTIRLIIITLISLVFAMYAYPGGSFWLILQVMAPVALIVFAVIGLEYKGKTFASHSIILVAGFLNAATAFINLITSFDFQSMSFTGTTPIFEAIIAFLIFIYLVLTLLSHMLTGNIGAKYEKSPVWTAALIAFLFFLFRSGFNVALMKLIPPIIALVFGAPFFAVVLLLAGVIDIPFMVINFIDIGIIGSRPISFFLFAAFGLYLIYGAVTTLIHMTKKA